MILLNLKWELNKHESKNMKKKKNIAQFEEKFTCKLFRVGYYNNFLFFFFFRKSPKNKSEFILLHFASLKYCGMPVTKNNQEYFLWEKRKL